MRALKPVDEQQTATQLDDYREDQSQGGQR